MFLLISFQTVESGKKISAISIQVKSPASSESCLISPSSTDTAGSTSERRAADRPRRHSGEFQL